MKAGVSHQRFFSDFYDSVQQRHYPTIPGEPGDATSLYIARLRFDTLMSRTPVLIDTQLLDGAFFLDIEPAMLTTELARRGREMMPIEIRSRASKLDEALLLFVKRPGHPLLRGFTFSTIQGENERSEARKRLESTATEKVSSWRDIPPILQSAGVPADHTEKLEAAWAHWIEAQEKGLVRVVKWQGGFDLEEALGDREGLTEHLQTADAHGLVKWVYDHRADRSLVDVQLSALRATWDGDKLADLVAIESWFHRAYNLAAAWQHECENYESVYDSLARPISLREKLLRVLLNKNTDYTISMPDLALDLPHDFLLKLGRMPHGMFKELFWKHDECFQKWWSEGDKDAFLKGVEPFVEAIIKGGEKRELPLQLKLLVSGAGAVAGFVGAPGALVGAVIGAILPLYVEYFAVEHVLSRPVRRVSQRIMQIAEERTPDEGTH